MAFHLNAQESVTSGIARNATGEIEKALDHLRGKRKPKAGAPPGAGADAEAVHEVRKSFKKVRAALRLLRGELGDEVYRRENYCFRDAARPLTEVRDAEMLVEALDELAKAPDVQIEVGALARVRGALVANRTEVTRRVLRTERAFAAVAQGASQALARLSARAAQGHPDRDGWAVLGGGVGRVYRRGRRALALAAASPTTENLHEWRKQAKYLWHVLQLLELCWTEHDKDLASRAHELSRRLGTDHDLAVLRLTLAREPLTYGGHRDLKGLFAILDRRRQELQREVFSLGRGLYADPPAVFTSRIEGYWNTWTARADAHPRAGRAARVATSDPF